VNAGDIHASRHLRQIVIADFTSTRFFFTLNVVTLRVVILQRKLPLLELIR
jgi:hypothetical protein